MGFPDHLSVSRKTFGFENGEKGATDIQKGDIIGAIKYPTMHRSHSYQTIMSTTLIVLSLRKSHSFLSYCDSDEHLTLEIFYNI